MLVRTIVVPRGSLPDTIRWMCGEVVVTSFAADRALGWNADVEARVAAGATGLGVTRLAIEHAVGEGSSTQTLGIRPVIGWEEVRTIQSMGHTATTGSVCAQFYSETGIGQLMGGIVAVASGSITTKIGCIVLCIRVHVDVAIPVITIHVCGVVEQGIISDRCEGTAWSRLLHAVADHAVIM